MTIDTHEPLIKQVKIISEIPFIFFKKSTKHASMNKSHNHLKMTRRTYLRDKNATK